jgi:hypothetical protein
MSATGTTDPAEQGVAALRAHEAELRRAGIRDVGLFGSVARGEAGRAATSTSPSISILRPAWSCFASRPWNVGSGRSPAVAWT